MPRKKTTTRKTHKTSRRTTRKDRDLFLKVLGQKAGNISKACEAIGVSRKTFYNWCRQYPDFKEAYEEESERIIDNVESHMMRRIQEGSDTMIIFFLKTRGKDRGYVERSEVHQTQIGQKSRAELQREAEELEKMYEKVTGTRLADPDRVSKEAADSSGA